ncbi:MAG: Mg2+/Co2+ transporter [Syntrophaceae bacterium]|nr:MAG: Mg2+/Co2+ transporter [Syntrophaceae bacterium]
MAINREPQVFLFLSKILGRNIVGATGETLGRVYDLTAEFVEPYPIVTGIIFRSAQKKILSSSPGMMWWTWMKPSLFP